MLTPGQAWDSTQFPIVLDKVRIPGPVGRPRTRPQAVAADRAYSSRANRAYLRRRHITAVIPEKIDQQANRRKKGSAGGRPVTCDPERYKQRNTVERCFQKIKTWRGLATRYDKAPVSYEAGLHLRPAAGSAAGGSGPTVRRRLAGPGSTTRAVAVEYAVEPGGDGAYPNRVRPLLDDGPGDHQPSPERRLPRQPGRPAGPRPGLGRNPAFNPQGQYPE